MLAIFFDDADQVYDLQIDMGTNLSMEFVNNSSKTEFKENTAEDFEKLTWVMGASIVIECILARELVRLWDPGSPVK